MIIREHLVLDVYKRQAYACGGISYSPRKSGYMQWKNVQAPWYWDSKQFALSLIHT